MIKWWKNSTGIFDDEVDESGRRRRRRPGREEEEDDEKEEEEEDDEGAIGNKGDADKPWHAIPFAKMHRPKMERMHTIEMTIGEFGDNSIN